MPNPKSKGTIATIMQAMEKAGLKSESQARTEALDKIGPVLLSALDEFHSHLTELENRLEKLEMGYTDMGIKLLDALTKQEEAYKTLGSYLLSFMDKQFIKANKPKK